MQPTLPWSDCQCHSTILFTQEATLVAAVVAADLPSHYKKASIR